MSDQSSESSGEWVVLNENDEELSLENVEEQPLKLELSYDAVQEAVSESIRFSLSSEDLEWQYEQFQDFIPQHGTSCIEELDSHEFITECIEDFDVNLIEDDGTSKCGSVSDFQDDKAADIVSATKIHCYKHNRNDRLNFILNLMLAVVVSSAIGLGTGHFLGWSHKCYKSATELNNAVYSSDLLHIVDDSSILPDTVAILQNVEDFGDKQKQDMNPTFFSENLSDISGLNPREGDSSLNQEICSTHGNNDIITDSVLPESSILMSEDVLELKTKEINQNNFSDTELSHISNIIKHIEWNKMHLLEEPAKGLKEKLEDSSSEELSSVHISDYLSNEDDINKAEFELLKQFYAEHRSSNMESNLTNQLRQDFNQVIHSLSAIAVARLTDVSNNYPLSEENSGIIVKYYIEFKNLINTKLSEIDNFVLRAEFKKYEKFSLKHLQKMVYSLIDSVDYLMKVSIKTLSKEKKINIYKFSNNISKVIFNFNKRWQKNNRIWSEFVEKAKYQEHQKYLKMENKHWKRKLQFEKEYRNNKYRRYSMKS